ncbi:hypothetical protein EG68_03600 [Paragonimus skrjabini miyazakii]|uniref:Uncharacterized protein n=1 Tax=Paragonimus skrjabini miyazakii TaxID=59628 RepID=A0A8S9Z149_9TREM|nr:hypothetical protein EG68_03600 [Paragonimus skrjabini miyazakii]
MSKTALKRLHQVKAQTVLSIQHQIPKVMVVEIRSKVSNPDIFNGDCHKREFMAISTDFFSLEFIQIILCGQTPQLYSFTLLLLQAERTLSETSFFCLMTKPTNYVLRCTTSLFVVQLAITRNLTTNVGDFKFESD